MKKMMCAIVAMVMMMTSAFALADEINVISREDGSGTRGAFIELFGIEQKNEAGEITEWIKAIPGLRAVPVWAWLSSSMWRRFIEQN